LYNYQHLSHVLIVEFNKVTFIDLKHRKKPRLEIIIFSIMTTF